MRALELPSAKSGVHRPRTHDDRRTPTGVQYNIFDSERYVLTLDDHALRDVASSAPYDFIEILVNEKQYGGGGIFNDQATAAVDTGFAEYVFVHEFGHHFAGARRRVLHLATSRTRRAAAEHPEPWEPNVTARRSGASEVAAISSTPGTPLPTPWDKEAFEKHQREYPGGAPQAARARTCRSREMDELFRARAGVGDEVPRRAEVRGQGRRVRRRGLRGERASIAREVDCIMFTRDEVGFCDVCSLYQ